MGRRKILHVIGGGEFGGAEQHLLTLFRHLDSSQFELQVSCLFPEPLASLVRTEGFPAHVFPMQTKTDLRPISKMASLIKREGFSIVHTHGVRANLIGRLAAKWAGAGHVVTTLHSVLAFDYHRPLEKWVNRFCENSTRGLTERFITVSRMLAEELKSQGVAEDRITTIYNGLEIEKYDPLTPGLPVRCELGLEKDDIVAGVIARLHPVKGHTYLLQAMAAAVEKLPRLKLLVVGTGADRPGLEAQARELGLQEKVVFTGFRSDIPRIIAASDFLVLPSLSEGLSLTVIEGMAMKKPVLATDAGGNPEIITPGVDGLLVPPANPNALAAGIEQLAGDRELASAMGEEARKTVEKRFTARMMAEKTAGIYRTVAGE